MRDIETDRRAGKHTLAVRLGGRAHAGSTSGSSVAAYRALLGTVTAHGGPWWALLGLLSAPLAIRPPAPSSLAPTGPALNGALAGTGALLGVFSLLVSLGLLIAA